VATQAIETRYAGCRFRSRLEARWAVFFDTLNIAWEYEPQGVQVSWRLSLREGTFQYLPDFWLPEWKLWVEVKGSLTTTECVRLLNAAAHLSSNGGGGCHDNGGHDLLILGPVPRPTNDGTEWMPIRLHMHKGLLEPIPWPGESGCSSRLLYKMGLFYNGVASDVGGELEIFNGESSKRVITVLLEGVPYPVRSRSMYAHALEAARSARFEHGETGHHGRL